VGRWIDGVHLFGKPCSLRICGSSQREKKEEPCCFHDPRMISTDARHGKPKSYPIQDEPEGEVGFQHKMSLERMAC
jgi:hypothetical protein